MRSFSETPHEPVHLCEMDHSLTSWHPEIALRSPPVAAFPGSLQEGTGGHSFSSLVHLPMELKLQTWPKMPKYQSKVSPSDFNVVLELLDHFLLQSLVRSSCISHFSGLGCLRQIARVLRTLLTSLLEKYSSCIRWIRFCWSFASVSSGFAS
eukprot:Skav224861  [mRNA]  locus=scaffold322:236461:236916:- [translate_table: standard]